MSNRRQIARQRKNNIRAEDCSEIAAEAINRHLTISINGKLNQRRLSGPSGMVAGAGMPDIFCSPVQTHIPPEKRTEDKAGVGRPRLRKIV
ncbi:MAG: hypothetical protein WAK45_08280 [Methanoregula sp.]|uniref:hypothetical protein n=1 Tax=Methanoregula sp. TaxID=2052170 RepID=UPI003BB12188